MYQLVSCAAHAREAVSESVNCCASAYRAQRDKISSWLLKVNNTGIWRLAQTDVQQQQLQENLYSCAPAARAS